MCKKRFLRPSKLPTQTEGQGIALQGDLDAPAPVSAAALWAQCFEGKHCARALWGAQTRSRNSEAHPSKPIPLKRLNLFGPGMPGFRDLRTPKKRFGVGTQWKMVGLRVGCSWGRLIDLSIFPARKSSASNPQNPEARPHTFKPSSVLHIKPC